MAGEPSEIESEAHHRSYGRPYTAKHPVPTVQGYREHKQQREQHEREQEQADAQESNQEDLVTTEEQLAKEKQQDGDADTARSKARRAFDSVKAIARGDDKNEHDPYPTANRNWADRPRRRMTDEGIAMGDNGDDEDDAQGKNADPIAPNEDKKPDEQPSASKEDEKKKKPKDDPNATEQVAALLDPKARRKAMKKHKRHAGGRQVTDPVTHLPITVRDLTVRDLRAAPENEPTVGTTARTKTGLASASKSWEQLERERVELERGHRGMRCMFPPPEKDVVKGELEGKYRKAVMVSFGVYFAIIVAVVLALEVVKRPSTRPDAWFGRDRRDAGFSWATGLFAILVVVAASATAYATATATSGWLAKKVDEVLENEVWTQGKDQETTINDSDAELPESVMWLNSLLSSVWPLINPDLFASLADTLEDVMQASLPKIIRMVSIDDIGQGSEAIRILGVRWLPTGAAGQSVDEEGQLQPAKQNDCAGSMDGEIDEECEGDEKKDNDRDGGQQDTKETDQERQAIAEGMEAEEGDFVNMELAFSYRARSSGSSIRSKAKNAHLYLRFYLPGGIFVPVWVELKGIIGIMRLRLQLTPDPPFFRLCTLTFLGQPRADLSCVPLSRHSLNIMDVPLISSFVQSSIDAALAEYVAPKSLTLDLKDVLVGDDFKKDTLARGVMVVYIKCARGFKEGDGGIGPLAGSSDGYVSVCWGKFGKLVASTRIITHTQEPTWNEWATVLVTPEEINADETLRVQLWDSDKYTADDDLGRVEIPLKELMHGENTKNRMLDREDSLRGEDPDEKMPGTLSWSVGYFGKARIQQCQLNKQTVDPAIRSVEQLEQWAMATAESKLREAASAGHDERRERHQQMLQDFKEREDEMVIAAPPPAGLPSGVLGIQIHNITGLEVSRPNRRVEERDEDREDEAEQAGNLPDSYCTIILNQRKIYRTRTKPKNAKPFFNAGTERFVRDWQTAEVIVSMRDSREHEDDPLLGIVYLPLRRVFEKRSQVVQSFPLAGGIGYGRARISLVWRSVELQWPPELRGWDYGTLEVKAPIRGVGIADDAVKGCKIRLRTKIGYAKMHAAAGDGDREDGGGSGSLWKPKHRAQDSVFLPVVNRYAEPLVLEFHQKALVQDATPALGVLWLGELPDEEDRTVTAPVWKGGKDNLKLARSCADYASFKHGKEEHERLGEVQLQVKFWRGLSGYHKGYASKSRNGHVRDVMEVLDTVNDEDMAEDKDLEGLVEEAEGEGESDGDGDGEEGEKMGGIRRASTDRSEDAEKRKMLRKAGAESSSSSSSSDDSDPDADGKKAHGMSAAKRPVKSLKSLPSRLKDRASSLLDGGDTDDDDDDDDGRRGAVAQLRDYRKHAGRLHRKHRGVMQWKTARTLDWVVGKVNRGRGRLGEIGRHGEKGGGGIETEV